MKPINTKFHGIIDYAMGLLLLSSPYFFELDGSDIESMVFYALGAFLIFYSLLTDYEFGLFRVFPMPAHLTLEALSGILLAASPWLFGFADRVFLPHVSLGIIEILTAFLTNCSRRDDSNRLI